MPVSYIRSSSKGFTLIELLVVIAIIGLLAAVVLASLNSARLKARNAKRLSDLHQVENALALYANANNNAYPNTPSADSTCGSAVPSCVGSLTGVLTPTYIQSLPTDPTYNGTGNNYRYCGSATQGVYMMLVRLEQSSNWCSISAAPPTGTQACYTWLTYGACT